MRLEQTAGSQPPLGTGDLGKVPVGLMLRGALALLHHSHQEPPAETEPRSAPEQDGHEVSSGLSAPPGACWQRLGGLHPWRCSEAPQTRFGWPRSGVKPLGLPGPFPAQAPCDGPGGQKGAGGKGSAAAPSPAHQSQLPDPAQREGKRNPGTSQPTETTGHPAQRSGSVPSSCRHLQKQFWPRGSSYFCASSTQHLIEHGSINHLALIFSAQQLYLAFSRWRHRPQTRAR